jgi:DNA-binding transcriptional LysR family regulator
VQRAQRLLSEALMIGEAFEPPTSRRVFRFALSDYALAVLYEPLMRRISAQAPNLSLEFDPISADARESDREILDHDVLIGPMGYGFPGIEEMFFRDRMVCIVDKGNTRLTDAELTLESLSQLPHAIATFGRNNLTPADRILGELGVNRRVQVAVTGWMALPFVIEGTDMVAVVPSRLAERFCTPDGPIAVIEPPFGDVDLIEGFWCQEAKLAEPAQQWLVSVLRDVAVELIRPVAGRTGHDPHR